MKLTPIRLSLVILSTTIRPAFPQNPAPSALLEETVVTAAPLARTLFEQAQPVSVLSGERLQLATQPTLGETLSRVPGVSSTYFGPAASRPVIRGLDADRIRVLQNGSNTLDASATSVDHAVSFDPVSVESIEVVRGPATLLYGPNAIGGVVNVLDGRIPEERIDRTIRGSVEGRYGSVNAERGGAFTLEGYVGGFQWHVEGYKRATDELHIPGFARSVRRRRLDPLPDVEKEARDVLPNSDLRTEGLSGGASWVWDGGFFGLAYSGFRTNYGTVAEREVTIDMEQRRWDFRGAFFAPFARVKAIKYSFGLSDYGHTEFEGAIAGTKFENEGYDGRIEIAHEKIGSFEGVIGYQTEKSAFSALGEEAFLPPVETVVNSVFLFEEVTLNPVRLQFGVRYDHVSVDADADPAFGAARGRTFDNVSASAGAIFTSVEGYAVALSAAFTQRAPTYQELFANGPHIATNAFEIGNPELDSEKSFSVDLSLRKKVGRITGAVSLFYNRFQDFIGQFADGTAVAGEEDELPIFRYRSTDADFLGGEAEITFNLWAPAAELPAENKSANSPTDPRPTRKLDLEFKTDYVRATDRSTGDPLPRIPPFRAGATLSWQNGPWSASLEGQYSSRQNRTADGELPTDSYFLVNASLGYRFAVGDMDGKFYIKGVNLADAEARVHTSFLKEIAPLGGREIIAGMKIEF